MKFLNWFEENRIETQITKMSLPAIAGFGIGYYLSDNLTGDEKQRTERNLEREWNRALTEQKQRQKRTPRNMNNVGQ